MEVCVGPNFISVSSTRFVVANKVCFDHEEPHDFMQLIRFTISAQRINRIEASTLMEDVVVHKAMALDTWFNGPMRMQEYGSRLSMND